MKTGVKEPAMANTIPFRNCRKLEDDLNELNKSLTKLRATLENGDVTSVGRAAAFLYVDFIERLLHFTDQFDVNIGFQLFTMGISQKDNFRQAKKAIEMYSRLSTMIIRAIDGLMSCLGGFKKIEIDATAQWAAAGDPTGRPDPERMQLLATVAAVIQAQNERRKVKRSR